ncbi:MAG TPA: FAD-binding oxidoreductase [Ilumatobacter sp.]|nr:FAD-binding oxidoreductase [Ilumatobacter sp.]
MTHLPHVPATRSEAIDLLRDALTGAVLAPGDPNYDDVRRAGPTPWPAPAAIVLATSTDDIVQSVRFARAQHVSVAVRSSGQRAGAAADGAVLIDTSRLDRVAVDVDCCTAVVDAGATWADVVAETERHGLTPVLGEWSQRSAVSDTLSGGLGWLARRHGFASDSVVSFELVTPDGLVVAVSADTHPELFWALSGAGDGSLGVVASIELELHPIGHVYAGRLLYPAEHALEVLTRWRAWITGTRPELTSSVVLTPRTVSVHGCWSGAVDAGRELVDEWRMWRAPDGDDWSERSIAATDGVCDDRLFPTASIMTNEWANALRDELLDELVDITRRETEPAAGVVEVRLVGGAARSRSGAAANGRSRCDQFLITLGEIEGSPLPLRRRLAPYVTGSVYLDRTDATERLARTRTAFGDEQWGRLCAVKAALDPNDRFRHGLLIAG